MGLRPLWIAGRFLSRLPFPDPGETTPAETGRSVPWYPFIGLLMGLLAALIATATSTLTPSVGAALSLIVWVWSTGGIHMDGLADSADAWIGGLGSRERTLAIMKDPRSGPAAVTTLGLVLIAKSSALQALIEAGTPWLLIWIPMLGRAQLVLILLTTPYAREQGMAADQSRQLPRRTAWASVFAALIIPLVMTQWISIGWIGVGLIGACLLLFMLGRHGMLQRIAGFTGDTAGALVELTETGLLLLCTILIADVSSA